MRSRSLLEKKRSRWGGEDYVDDESLGREHAELVHCSLCLEKEEKQRSVLGQMEEDKRWAKRKEKKRSCVWLLQAGPGYFCLISTKFFFFIILICFNDLFEIHTPTKFEFLLNLCKNSKREKVEARINREKGNRYRRRMRMPPNPFGHLSNKNQFDIMVPHMAPTRARIEEG
jgi:hypothetical protein